MSRAPLAWLLRAVARAPRPAPADGGHTAPCCSECAGGVHGRQLAEVYEATLEALARAIDAHDESEDESREEHVRRMRRHATALAERLGLSHAEIAAIRAASVLHDIGKLGVPTHILTKPGPLTAEEFERVRAHPQVGAGILGGVPFPYPVAPLVLGHHERWDGKGYPAGLAGEEIPIGARVLAVVDCYDSLTSRRPYRGPIDHDGAVEVLRYEAGKSLDPDLVRAFVEVLGSERAAAEAGSTGQEAQAVPRARSALRTIALVHRETVALSDLSRVMSRGLGLADTARLVADGVSGLVPSACRALYVADAREGLACRFAEGAGADVLRRLVLPPGAGPLAQAMAERRPLVNGHPAEDQAASQVLGPVGDALELRSTLAAPLTLEDRLVGALAVYHREPGFYTDDHRRLLEQVAAQAAIVVHNSLAFDRAREESLTDALTGLPNTRFFLMHFTQELARAVRMGFSLALLVLDIDDFKRINDSAGHGVGDLALREVANALKRAVRPYDVCARYAGDEFVVMLPECGAEEAEERRREIEAIVRELRVETTPGEFLGMSASVGAAVFPDDGHTYEALLEAADARMYASKRARGRPARARAPRPSARRGADRAAS